MPEELYIVCLQPYYTLTRQTTETIKGSAAATAPRAGRRAGGVRGPQSLWAAKTIPHDTVRMADTCH